MPDTRQTIISAFYAHQKRRPFKLQQPILQAVIPPGGNWEIKFDDDTRKYQIKWGINIVAIIDPNDRFGMHTTGDIGSAVRAIPACDAALRIIHELTRSHDNLPLIAEIAETIIAYIELPAPKPPVEDGEEDQSEDDSEDGWRDA